MTMLSGIQRKAPRPPRVPRSHFAMEQGDHGIQFEMAGEVVEALPEGALWAKHQNALIVSDLHLEKASSFARRGQMLPPYDTRATLDRLHSAIARVKPHMIVSLGDSFHDKQAPERLDHQDAQTIQSLTAAHDWIWIEGNHDPLPPKGLGGRTAAELKLGTLTLRHEPTGDVATGEVAGHLHPCAAVSARGRRLRARCFATCGTRLVMPAFGAFTGGLNVCDEAFAPIFPKGCSALLLARGRVYPAPGPRLLPDA